jgi:hypothetical protein
VNDFDTHKLSMYILLILLQITFFQREYEEFKVRVNGLVAKAQKVPDEGWVMQDGTPWPGNNIRDHPGMIQVCPFSN